MDSIRRGLLDSETQQYNAYTDATYTPPRLTHNDSQDSFYYSQDSEEMDEELPDEAMVASKELELEQLRQLNYDLKRRFIWDLSLAMKRKLCCQHDSGTAIFQTIARVPISKIVEEYEQEQPEIDDWLSWINDKLTRQV